MKLLVGLTLLTSLLYISQASGLNEKFCQKDNCSGEHCERVLCLHGDCTADGACVCDSCWDGHSCDQPVNKHVPHLIKTIYSEVMSTSTAVGTTILQIEAVDDDVCNDNQNGGCGCSSLEYQIMSGNDDGVFSIERHTGYMMTRGPLTKSVYYMTVMVKNPDKFTGDTQGRAADWPRATVAVHTTDDPQDADHDEESHHHIHKRSLEVTPDNVTFYLEKSGIYENTTEMRVGSKVKLELLIHLPLGTTDMLVELFTPDNDTTVMVICNPEVTHVGDSLNITADDVTAVLDAKDSSANYDRAVLDLGYVNNVGGGTALDNMVKIEWQAIMVENADTVNASTYWVSAGAEYENENEIWVGQFSFTTIIDEYVPDESPTFNFTGPSEMLLGSSAVYRVDIYMPYPSTTLAFDAFASVNSTSDALSVCSVVLVDTAVNYECLEKDRFTPTPYASSSGKGNSRARLDFGTVTNKGSREDSNPVENNRISVEFVLYAYDNKTNVAGDTAWIGAALEIGDDTIWAGQMMVTLVDNLAAPALTTDPVLELTTLGTTNVSLYQSVSYELDINLPSDSLSDYDLEILMPFNDSARMKVCEVSLLYLGSNMPCSVETEPEYLSRDIFLPDTMDRVTWNLGRIANTGHYSVADDPDANTIRIKISAQVMNHTLNEEGELLWISVGVTYDGTTKLWVAQNAVVLTLTDSANMVVDAPEFEYKFAFGDNFIPVGTSTNVHLEITTVPGVLYSPMTFEMLMPIDNETDTAIYSLCRTEVISVGANHPCFDLAPVNDSVQLVSRTSDNKYDRALITIGSICNTRDASVTPDDPYDDKLVISMAIKIEKHPLLSNGSQYWVSGGVSYSDTQIWVGELALYAITDEIVTVPDSDDYMSVYRADGDNDGVMVGSTATYELLYKLPPQTSTDLTLTVDVPTSSLLSVCHVYYKEAGYDLACVDSTLNTTTGNLTEEHGAGLGYKTAVFDLGVITNVGSGNMTANDTFDNDTLVVNVLIHLDHTAAASSTHTVDFILSHGVDTTTETVTIQAIDAVISNDTSSVTMPSFDFNLVPFNDTDSVDNYAVKGEMLRFHLDITMADYSENYYEVKFLTPVDHDGAMEICEVNVLFVGDNLPCVHKSAYSATLSSRPASVYIDIGDVPLGYVCHFPVVQDIAEANQVRIEAIAKVTRQNSLVVGDTVWFSATTKINDDQIYVSRVAVIISDDTAFNDSTYDPYGADVVVNVTSPISARPGEIITLPVVVTVPANSSLRAYLEVNMPVADSAVMTVRSLKMISAGLNLGCLMTRPDEDHTITYNSTQLTTQMDNATYDFFILANTGVTYRLDEYDPSDDQIHFEVEIQMADSPVNTQSSLQPITVSAILGSTEVTTQAMWQVTRDTFELPELEMTVDGNISLLYDAGDRILLTLTLKHKNDSSAEARDTFVRVNMPRYLLLDHSSYPPTQNSPSLGYLDFDLGEFFFTDTFDIELEFLRSNESVANSGVEANMTVVVETTCTMLYRTGHVDPTGTVYVTPQESLTFTVVAPPDDTCSSALGLENGDIQDCQLTSSHTPDDTLGPEKARLNHASGWLSGVRYGSYKPYLQVKLGNMTRITAVALEYPTSLSASSTRVSSYALLYGSDGTNWKTAEVIVMSVGYPTTTTTLTPPVEARYVRIEVLGSQDGGDYSVGIRMELYGCAVSADVTPQDVCDYPEEWCQTASTDDGVRQFVAGSGIMFMCSTLELNKKCKSAGQCYSTSSSGEWDQLPVNLRSLIGYDPVVGELLALGDDGVTYMSSEDDGVTWRSVSDTHHDDVTGAATFIPVTQVEWVRDAALDPAQADPHASYTDSSDTFGASYKGMCYKSGSWATVASWEQCCV